MFQIARLSSSIRASMELFKRQSVSINGWQRWKHYRQTKQSVDFMGNKQTVTTEWDDDNSSDTSRISSSSKLPKSFTHPKIYNNPTNQPSKNNAETAAFVVQTMFKLINAAVEEWQSNAQLRKSVRLFIDNVSQWSSHLLIGPPAEQKKQFERIDRYDWWHQQNTNQMPQMPLIEGSIEGTSNNSAKSQNQSLPDPFQSTASKLAKALQIPKFPAPSHVILGVSKDAGSNEIKERYLQLVKIWHPDLATSADKKKFHGLIFTEINCAYDEMNKKESHDTWKQKHQLSHMCAYAKQPQVQKKASPT